MGKISTQLKENTLEHSGFPRVASFMSHFGFPPVATLMSHFYQKDICGS